MATQQTAEKQQKQASREQQQQQQAQPQETPKEEQQPTGPIYSKYDTEKQYDLSHLTPEQRAEYEDQLRVYYESQQQQAQQ